jgi:hypothetical protein
MPPRLTLNGFPTAQRMHTGTSCVACGAPEPGVQHHCWECPVADAVRAEVEGQLRVHRVGEGQPWLAADRRLRCAALWMGVLPNPQLHRMVWDMVCLAGIGAVEFGPQSCLGCGSRGACSAFVDSGAHRQSCCTWGILACIGRLFGICCGAQAGSMSKAHTAALCCMACGVVRWQWPEGGQALTRCVVCTCVCM